MDDPLGPIIAYFEGNLKKLVALLLVKQVTNVEQI